MLTSPMNPLTRQTRGAMVTSSWAKNGLAWTPLLLVLLIALTLPTLSIWGSWLQWDSQQAQMIGQLLHTVLPEYAWTSLLLCVGVAVGVIAMGTGAAALVTLFEFPGRRWLEWALLLPLAMPAYVVAYAYTDFFQYSGPLQTHLRTALGLEGALWPDIRSTWGAVLVFTVTLYPYVYLLARTALLEQSQHLHEAAQLLGASRWRRILTVSLPMARPAIAAGTALALMETLADFGVTSYFGVQSFTAGIYKAWLSMDNMWVAGQLATVLLLAVALLLTLEKNQQRRIRYAQTKVSPHTAQRSTLQAQSHAMQWLLLSLALVPLILGFVLPTAVLMWSWLSNPEPLNASRFWLWTWNSLYLAMMAAVLAVVLALTLAIYKRIYRHRLSVFAINWVSLGYAAPGAVVVVGILMPMMLMRQHWPDSTWSFAITGTSVGLVWAYLVRFTSVAVQSIESGYSRIPKALDETSRTLGMVGWKLISRVHLPLLKRSSAAALLLVFVDVMKELPATFVLRPFNHDTLAVVAYQLARDERLGEAALPSLALVLAGLIPVLLISKSLRRKS
ncbi:MAG: Sulfate transport system permease protein CysW [Pseudomonadota bacterium]